MDMIPRTKNRREIRIPKNVDVITVVFSMEQVRAALLAMYGDTPVGPEGYRIPADCQVHQINDEQFANGQKIGLEWNEEPRA